MLIMLFSCAWSQAASDDWHLEPEKDKFGDDTEYQLIVCTASGKNSMEQAFTGTVSCTAYTWHIRIRDDKDAPVSFASQLVGGYKLSLKVGDRVIEESLRDYVTYGEEITFSTDAYLLGDLAYSLLHGRDVKVRLEGEYSPSYAFTLEGAGFAKQWYKRASVLFEKKEYQRAENEFAVLAKYGYPGASEQVQACEDGIHGPDYEAAVKLFNDGKYEEARSAFKKLDTYKDSAAQVQNCTDAIYERDYQAAAALFTDGKYEEAGTAFKRLGSYRDSADMVKECDYQPALALFNGGKYEEAKEAFTALGTYKDSAAQVQNCMAAINESDYQAAAALLAEGKYEEAKAAFTALGNYKDSAAQVNNCEDAIHGPDYQAAAALLAEGKYEEAKEAFTALESYKDSAEMVKECDYQKATALYVKGDYAGAVQIFITVKSYKDVTGLLANDQNLSAAAAAAARKPFTRVGNIVTYGHYEQDNNRGNGKEPIEWIVLKYNKKSGRSLLLSLYGLDAHRFDASKYRGWAKSEMRSWLNGTFLNNAFTAEEKAGIVTTTVKTGNNAAWVAFAKKQRWKDYASLSGGAATKDKVFLLSLEEAMEYGGYSTLKDFYNNGKDKMKAIPTEYAVAQGAYQYRDSRTSNKLNGTGCCRWWLRSPGYSSDRASRVYYDGSLSSPRVDDTDVAVRPAFWLDLNSADIY